MASRARDLRWRRNARDTWALVGGKRPRLFDSLLKQPFRTIGNLEAYRRCSGG